MVVDKTFSVSNRYCIVIYPLVPGCGDNGRQVNKVTFVRYDILGPNQVLVTAQVRIVVSGTTDSERRYAYSQIICATSR